MLVRYLLILPLMLLYAPIESVDPAMLGHGPVPLGLGVHHVQDARLLTEWIPTRPSSA